MKKCIMTLSVLVISLIATCAGAFATELDEQMASDVELAYTTSTSVQAIMSISNGTASGKVGSYLKAGQTVDYANVTVYIKKSTGTTVKTFTQKMYPSLGKITWKGTHSLAAKGTYYLQAVTEYYKGGKLIETVTVKSSNCKY